MEEEREVCTGLHNGETTPSQLHEARCTGSPSCLSSLCTKDANLTPVLDLCSPAAGFPSCCPKVVKKLSQSCPPVNLTSVPDLSSHVAGFPSCCPKVVTRLSQSCPLVNLTSVPDLSSHVAGSLSCPATPRSRSTARLTWSSTCRSLSVCLLICLCIFLTIYLSTCVIV